MQSFKTLAFTAILTFVLVPDLKCQSMTDLFRVLPASCTEELNSKERGILIKQGEYIIPGGDSNETAKYELDTSSGKNYLSCSYYFTTGQRAFIDLEIKKFKKINGAVILVYSKYGGTPNFDVQQREFKIYTVQHGRLIESREALIPYDIGLKDVLRKGYSDSLYREIQSMTNSSFQLNLGKENELEFCVSAPSYPNEYKKYMLGNAILFVWDGRSFRKRIIWDNQIK